MHPGASTLQFIPHNDDCKGPIDAVLGFKGEQEKGFSHEVEFALTKVPLVICSFRP